MDRRLADFAVFEVARRLHIISGEFLDAGFREIAAAKSNRRAPIRIICAKAWLRFCSVT
jgi:hypothetical protein